MVAKTPSKKPRSSKSTNTKPASPRSAKVARPEQPEQPPKAVMGEEKSVKTLRTITNYLTGTLFSCGVGILFNSWWVFTRDGTASLVALFNVFAFVGLGAILFLCIRLLKQMSMRAFSVFLVFVLASLACSIIYRVLSATPLFAPVDIILYIFIAVGVSELYKLKKNGILH